jgi:predicted Fe-Mo cluster-binding NifX family protein
MRKESLASVVHHTVSKAFQNQQENATTTVNILCKLHIDEQTEDQRRRIMKIALPTRGTQIDGHFGHCETFTIFTISENREIVQEEILKPPAGCGCKSSIIPELAGKGVSVMLAGNMGEGARAILEQNGIQVFRGCGGEARESVKAWLAGTVSDSGAGCKSHEGGECGHH